MAAMEHMSLTNTDNIQVNLFKSIEALINQAAHGNDFQVVVWLKELRRKLHHYIDSFPVILSVTPLPDEPIDGSPGSDQVISLSLEQFDKWFADFVRKPRT